MKTFQVSDEQLVEALRNAIDEMDMDDLADAAQYILGGDIRAGKGYLAFDITPDDTYYGALDHCK